MNTKSPSPTPGQQDEIVHLARFISPKHVSGTLCGQTGMFQPNLSVVTCEDCWRIVLALPTPPGRWVPNEPTEKMWLAFFSHNSTKEGSERYLWSGDFGNFHASYRAMLEAAPAGGGER